MPLHYLLEQVRLLVPSRSPSLDELIQIKFFPLRDHGSPVLISAPTIEEAFSLAKKHRSSRNKLIALQEKESYDAAVAALNSLLGDRPKRLFRSPAPPGP